MVNKVTMTPVTGANNITNINDNFNKLERVINDTMLSRKVGSGQPNQVLTTIDMNGQRLINLPDPKTSGEPVTFRYVESVQASVDGLEDLVVQAQGQLTAAQLANQQAQGILVDTRVIQVDVIQKANQVNVQAGQVAAQASQVNTQTGQVAASASAAAASASASAGSATTAGSQATNAAASATAANNSKLAAEAAVTAANVAKDAAASSATTSANSATASASSATAAATSATNAANAAASINQPFLLNRANHTGTQAISTVVNLQTTLDAKKNISDNTTIAQGGTGATTAAGARTNLGLGTAAVAAILGTVSQSGGVPTGAIVQKGSNANGEFVKFADGTQICWKIQTVNTTITNSDGGGVLYSGLIDLGTYASAFSPSAPAVILSVSGGSGAFPTSAPISQTISVWGNCYLSSGANRASAAYYISCIAIGRWF